MKNTGSIGRRLTLLLAGIAALLSVLSWAMVTSLARQAAERTQDNVLAASVTTIAETLRSEQGEVRLELPYSAFSMLGAISEDRVFYRVATGDTVLTGYAGLPVPKDGLSPDGRIFFDTGEFSGEEIRIATISRLVLAGTQPVPVNVTVAQTRGGVASISAELSQLAALLSVAFFLVAVSLSAFAAHTSLRPLNEIAAAVSRRGPSDLRPLRRAAPTELAPLMTSLNRLMDRLGQSIRSAEDFIAEAAHRIRTPLATVRAQAEIALRSAETDAQKQRLRQMIRAVDESSRSAGQLLDHATVTYRTDDLVRSSVQLPDLVGKIVAGLEPTAAMKDIHLHVEMIPATVQVAPILMENALRNVLDNAIKYSLPDTTVTISASETDGQIRIAVKDQGPGLGEGPVDMLTERFQRGSNAQGIVGSGLGLTIAKDVLVAHGGQLVLENLQGRKGTCATLILPSC